MRSRLVPIFVLLAIVLAAGEFTRFGEYITEFADAAGLESLNDSFPVGLAFSAVVLPLAAFYYLHSCGLLHRPAAPGSPAVQRNNAGLSLFDRGALQAAIVEFTEAVRLDPRLGVAYYNRGNTYLSLDRLDVAAADFDAALPNMRNGSKVYAGIGYLWAKRGDLDRALAEYETALQLDQTNCHALTSRGNLHHFRGDWQRALADFDRALFYAPTLDKAYTGRAMVWLSQGRIDDALADIEQALCFGGGADALALRARIWLDRQDFDRAIADLDDAIEAGTRDAAAFRDRGLAWLFKCNFKKAIADSNQALALAPNDAISFNNRGTAYLRIGMHEKALADLKQAQVLLPKLPNVYKNLAWLQATCPKPEFRNGAQAVANAVHALELAQWKMPDWLPILAAAHAEAGQFEEAVRWQSEFLAQAPPHSKAEAQAALDLYQAGKPYRDERAPVT